MTVAQIEHKKGKKKSVAQNLWFLHWLMAYYIGAIDINGLLPFPFSNVFCCQI